MEAKIENRNSNLIALKETFHKEESLYHCNQSKDFFELEIRSFAVRRSLLVLRFEFSVAAELIKNDHAREALFESITEGF